MAGKSAILSVKILVDAAKAQQGMDKAAGGIEKFQQRMGKAAIPAAAAGAALVAFGKSAVDSASRTQQAMGGIESVFGSSADQVKAWADAAADAVGLSKSEYGELATVIGSQLKNMGVPMDEVAGQTDELVRKGADLAAMYGGTTADAVSALSSLLKGETDPIERYGVGIKQADIAARMAADGTDKLKGEAAKAAKTQALLGMMTDQTADSLNKFADEGDTAATAAQKAGANWENTKATLGETLLPVVAAVTDYLGRMAKLVGENAQAFQIMAGVVGGLAAAILAVNGAMKAYAVVQGIVTAAQKFWSKSLLGTRIQLALLTVQEKAAAVGAKLMAAATWVANGATKALAVGQRLLSAAFLSSPIGWIVLGIMLLVGAFVLAYKRSSTFRALVQGAFKAIKAAATAMAQGVMSAVRAVAAFFQRVAAVLAPGFLVAFKLISAVARLAFAVIKVGLKVVQLAVTAVAWVIIKLFNLAWKVVSKGAKLAMAVVRSVIRAVSGPAKAVATGIRSVFQAGFRVVSGAAKATVSAVKTGLRGIPGVARSVGSSVKSAFSTAFNAMKAAGKAVVSGIKAAFHALPGPVKDIIRNVVAFYADSFGRIVDKAKAIVDRIVSTFGRIASAVRGIHLPNPFAAMSGWIDSLVGQIDRLIGWLGRIHVPKISIPGVGKSAPAASSSTFGTPSLTAGISPMALTARPRAAGAAGAGGITVVVNGALDPDAVARQIERILTRRARRVGGVASTWRGAGVAVR